MQWTDNWCDGPGSARKKYERSVESGRCKSWQFKQVNLSFCCVAMRSADFVFRNRDSGLAAYCVFMHLKWTIQTLHPGLCFCEVCFGLWWQVRVVRLKQAQGGMNSSLQTVGLRVLTTSRWELTWNEDQKSLLDYFSNRFTVSSVPNPQPGSKQSF